MFVPSGPPFFVLPGHVCTAALACAGGAREEAAARTLAGWRQRRRSPQCSAAVGAGKVQRLLELCRQLHGAQLCGGGARGLRGGARSLRSTRSPSVTRIDEENPSTLPSTAPPSTAPQCGRRTTLAVLGCHRRGGQQASHGEKVEVENGWEERRLRLRGFFFFFLRTRQGGEGRGKRVVHGKEKKADDEGRGKTGEEGWDMRAAGREGVRTISHIPSLAVLAPRSATTQGVRLTWRVGDFVC